MTHVAPERGSYDPDDLRAKYREERDKRVRSDRSAQYLDPGTDLAEALGHFNDDLHVEGGFTRDALEEDIDVVVVGGGLGGLLTATDLRKRDIGSFRIVDQAGDFGGTWYWNRYPGVRCDIESYCYMPLLEEVGTVPTERYAHGAEIFAHYQAIARHYDLYDRALFQTRVTEVRWDESAARWLVSTSRGDVLRARFVAICQGPLSKLKLPGIPGIDRFKGKMFHSARWDYAYTGGDSTGGQVKLEDKRVAIIGTGATAVQIVPRLAQHAQRLYLFQRTPSAIDERNNAPTDLEWFKNQPPGWQKTRMRNFLSIITGVPQKENLVGDRWTDFWLRFSGAMAESHGSGAPADPHDLMQRVDFAKMEELRARVDLEVSHPETAAAMKPWYNYLCKRPLYSDEFLKALNQDNVTLVDTQGRGVDSIGEHEIVAGGRTYEVDCIVFATGFDVGAAAHKVGGYKVVGRNGLTLDDKWRDGVRTVHGMQMAGFPNFYIVGATLQGAAAFNFTSVLTMQAEHATTLIAGALSEGVKTLEVTEDAEDRWLVELRDKHIDRSHFYEECTPGFLNNEGDFKDRPTFIGGTYGGGPLEYERHLINWREELSHQDGMVLRQREDGLS